MKIKLFYLSTFVLSCALPANFVLAQMDAGFYHFSQGPTSEVTSAAPRVVEAPPARTPTPPTTRPTTRPATPIATAQVAATPAAPATTAQDYTTRRTGSRAAGGEILTRLESCGSLRMILGKKSRRAAGRSTCAPLTIAESFVPTLMSQLPTCIREGATAKGINKQIKSSDIYNAGAYGQRSGETYSMHEAGRGFDIYQIDVTFADGTKLYSPMTISKKNDDFYKGFNKCWERLTSAVMSRMSSRCRNYVGLLDCNDNRAHHDHVHVSLPYCPKKAGFRTY